MEDDTKQTVGGGTTHNRCSSEARVSSPSINCALYSPEVVEKCFSFLSCDASTVVTAVARDAL